MTGFEHDKVGNIKDAIKKRGFIDCGTNEELFIALASLRDDTDINQLVEISLAFSSTLNFDNLLESIIYMSMAQMHVMGGEIFVRDFITNEYLTNYYSTVNNSFSFFSPT